jgi:hypothetical protein
MDRTGSRPWPSLRPPPPSLSANAAAICAGRFFASCRYPLIRGMTHGAHREVSGAQAFTSCPSVEDRLRNIRQLKTSRHLILQAAGVQTALLGVDMQVQQRREPPEIDPMLPVMDGRCGELGYLLRDRGPR